MIVESKSIVDVKLVISKRHSDSRGFFSETWSRRRFGDNGIEADFVQDNHSFSTQRGTVRGLHYQAPPFAQAKLVRVGRGAVLDVAVDVRCGSSTYGAWTSHILTAEGGEQLWIPRGFLHGFVTLEPDTEVLYKVDNPYSAVHEGAVRFDDCDLSIDWGIPPSDIRLSDKDAQAGAFRDFASPFVHGAAA